LENLKGKNLFENIRKDGKIILKCVFEKEDV
jgi:hypothetical protein